MSLSKCLVAKGLVLVMLYGFINHEVWAKTHYYDFKITSTPYSRLCETKSILTVNGQFPGPTLYVKKGDIAYVKVFNEANYNVTLHWHGVKQPRNPWSDGPEYITQCPIQSGANFTYKIIFSTEEGTLWWHAHSDWTRATVHGAIVIYPKQGTTYPFPKPHKDVPIILGDWWKSEVNDVAEEAFQTGGDPNVSDALTINGQPGDRFPCSKPGTFKLAVEQGKTYLLRLINAVMNDEIFFSVAQHRITLVGIDASYTKPLTTNYIMIAPGQTMDILLEANQPPNLYYMASRIYSVGRAPFDNTTATAILQYTRSLTSPSSPAFPSLPFYNDTQAAFDFVDVIRSLANKDHPIDVPLTIDERIIITLSINTLPCPNSSCEGPDGNRLSASMNNISFVTPEIDLLQAYYNGINGVFGDDFPNEPPFYFNFTAEDLPDNLLTPKLATEVKVLEYNSNVELVFQGTNLRAGENHPMHLHGYNLYMVGWGFGIFDEEKDPLGYNLVDPPEMNTVEVPRNGWLAVRFRLDNPGVWLIHCHFERHVSWGMNTVLIVKNGPTKEARLLSPPPYMPPC